MHFTSGNDKEGVKKGHTTYVKNDFREVRKKGGGGGDGGVSHQRRVCGSARDEEWTKAAHTHPMMSRGWTALLQWPW